MAEKPDREFGRRKPVAIQATVPVKRSSHVALLLMGTFAIGGGAYALTPGENCGQSRPGMAAANAECPPRGSSSGGDRGSSGGSSRSRFFGGDTSSGHSSSGTASDSGSGGVTRGGFGGFAHAFTSHFSGGG
jgi:type IV secretory pathway TrbL component